MVICTTGKLRMLLLIIDLVIAAAVGVFVYETIEHPAHDAAAPPADGRGTEQVEAKEKAE